MIQEEGPRPGQQVIEVVLPTYSMIPAEQERFYPSEAKRICERVLVGELDNKEYFEDSAKDWIISIGNTIKSEIKCLTVPRYKIIVQVTIGQMKDQGVSVASRCLWDITFDNYTSVNFTNSSLWANVMVFGVYTD
ncbi:hypothetical protein AURANDRAFT_34069 [Aureococcus anophagefferens]|jgi:hypothetical protein|uniref:Dynein light chain n=1 Tax=Aureococcus anophagefferens TaxID=44056 RepID=F0YN77_AURAN|nr:hypothetical protein AURANDRAFT_34069 [Aureococcus anophagefferens]EGB03433.1 hypothetical protein AURANDRAFT_34069 [Aureococcus anophagefferens]|eukprot:XP_009041904.1 hypothetical protein AURANDRAFT_34069 [Aureococcus anophagefferens]